MEMKDVSWCPAAIDDIKKQVKTGMLTHFDQHSREIMIRQLRVAQKFKLPVNGEVFSASPKSYLLDGMKLPFDVCALEFALNDNTQCILLVSPPAYPSLTLSKFVVAALVKYGSYRWFPIPILYGVSQDNKEMYASEMDLRDSEMQLFKPLGSPLDAQEPDAIMARSFMADNCIRLLDFMSLMACKNIETEKVEAPPRNKQGTRIALGREPLCDFHILKIKMGHGESHPLDPDHQPGTPHRFHWVRGHIRQYASGHQTFVRPHTRGNPALGSIEKVYEVS